MGDKHGELSGALKVLVYSDDHAVREQVKVALTGMIAPDLPHAEVVETATQASVVDAVSSGHYDVLIADGESAPYGGMGVCHQLHPVDPVALPQTVASVIRGIRGDAAETP